MAEIIMLYVSMGLVMLTGVLFIAPHILQIILIHKLRRLQRELLGSSPATEDADSWQK